MKTKLNLLLRLLSACLLCAACGLGDDPRLEITYTTVTGDGDIVLPDTSYFDAPVVKNVCVDSVCHLCFEKPLTTIRPEAFYGMKNLKTVKIPASVTVIGASAFADCSSLEQVDFAEGSQLEVIESKAFAATGLRRVSLPATVEKVGVAAFAACTNLECFEGKFASNGGRALVVKNLLISVAAAGLKTYTLDDASVHTLGDFSFYGFTELETVNLPASVKSIGQYVFADTPALREIYFSSRIAPLLSIRGESFEFTENGPVLYVPAAHPYSGHNHWYLLNKRGHMRTY